MINAVPHQNTVLHALLKLVPWQAFEQAIQRHHAADLARRFSFKSHLAAMLYVQLAGVGSLRHVPDGMRSDVNRFYHLGVQPARQSTLADGYRDRPPRCSSSCWRP